MRLPILCFDLDGTLLDVDACIHLNDIKLLTAFQPSALFIACTGQPLSSVRRTFTRNGLFNDQKIPFPLVLQNGSLIFGSDEEFLAYYSTFAP